MKTFMKIIGKWIKWSIIAAFAVVAVVLASAVVVGVSEGLEPAKVTYTVSSPNPNFMVTYIDRQGMVQQRTINKKKWTYSMEVDKGLPISINGTSNDYTSPITVRVDIDGKEVFHDTNSNPAMVDFSRVID
jgi:hypothetical protein